MPIPESHKFHSSPSLSWLCSSSTRKHQILEGANKQDIEELCLTVSLLKGLQASSHGATRQYNIASSQIQYCPTTKFDGKFGEMLLILNHEEATRSFFPRLA